MSNSNIQRMFSVLEEELRALIDVVVKVDPQAAMTFSQNLLTQVQKLKREDKKMMDAMNASTGKIQAMLEKQRALLAEKEASLNRTKVLLDEMRTALDMQKKLQDEREVRIAQREAELGLSNINNLSGMAQA